MFCKYCGTETADDAQFCPKCGKSTGTQVVQNNAAVPQQNNPGGINLKILIPLVAVIAVLCVVIVIKLTGKSDTNSDSIVGGDLPVEEDIQCTGCKEALAAYSALLDSAQAYGDNKDEINACSARFYSAMHHNCTADITNVENVPFVYRGCSGTYTGEWKGAGPFGTGAFDGKTKNKNRKISYSGDWSYGLPEGTGNLYVEDFAESSWNMYYTGTMQAGNREGTGYIYEFNNGGAYNPMFRIYDEATFQNDIMTSVTDLAQYDNETGELLYYDRVTGDDSGWVTEITHWGANELNPEQKQLLDLAGCVFVGVAVAKYAQSIHEDYVEVQRQMDKQEILSELDNIKYQLVGGPLY